MDYRFISSLRNDPSLTLFLGMPNDEKDNTKYAIVLKNLIAEVKKELKASYSDKEHKQLLAHLDTIVSNFHPSLKSESIVFFVSNDFNEQIVVPFVIESSFNISDRFTTRKLLRKSNHMNHYYVLTLTSDEARLLEYQNDLLIQEYNDSHFPIANNGYWTSDALLHSMGSVRSNYQKEFYKLIDSELQAYINKEPHPIVLASVAENAAIYREIANKNDLLVGEINGNFTTSKGESTHDIGKKSYEVIKSYLHSQQKALIEGLDNFNSKGRLEQDLVVIYMAAIKGKAKELIVDEEYFQEAVIADGKVVVDSVDTAADGYVEDLINEIIYQVMRYGGDVTFTTKATLQAYGPILLKTRF